MSRSIELNLIAMDIQKDIVYTVEEGTSLEDVSEELAKLYRENHPGVLGPLEDNLAQVLLKVRENDVLDLHR